MASPCENTELLKAHTAGIDKIAAKQDRIEESHRELVQEIRSMVHEMRAMFGAEAPGETVSLTIHPMGS